jgi:hypothetical protein
MRSSDSRQRRQSRYSCCGVERGRAQEHPAHWQAAPAQDGGEGQKISLCEVPETQPQAREDSGAVVLPSLSGCDGRERSGLPVKILYLHGWNSVVGGVKPTYLKSHGHEVHEPALDHEDFQAALATAQRAFGQHQPDVVVGSSQSWSPGWNRFAQGRGLGIVIVRPRPASRPPVYSASRPRQRARA